LQDTIITLHPASGKRGKDLIAAAEIAFCRAWTGL
jgi:hypothetical protein